MQKSQVRRSTVARRVLANRPAAPVARVSIRETSDAVRRTSAADIRAVKGPAVEKARKAPRLTATQKDSEGRRSAWSAPGTLPYSLAVTTSQPRWSMTVRDMG